MDSSLRVLGSLSSYRFKIRVETWIGVSGYSIYGEEKGEGSLKDGDFSVSVVRSSPSGEENFTIISQEGELYLKKGEELHPVTAAETPNPLYDPRYFLSLVTAYNSLSREGEEEINGIVYQCYLLQYNGDRAREFLSEGAWSYFSNLDYNLSCRVWINDAGAPPASLRLEVVGLDRQESLQRHRLLVTLEPSPLE